MSNNQNQLRSGTDKELVYYHRSYRKIPGPEKRHLIPFLSLILVIEVLLYLFLPDLNHLVSRCAREILVRSMIFENVEIIGTEFLWRPITVLNVPGSHPGLWFSAVNAVLALLVIIFLPKTKCPKPVTVVSTLVSLIHLVSGLFFLFIPDRFPYQVIDFSTTSVVMVIATWFLIPVVYGFTLYPLPASLFSKALIILFTIAFSATFHVFRYALFLYLISAYSFIYMAVLFFCFGILLDMTFLVGFYSFYLSLLSRRLRQDSSVWQWLY